jgi:hypothetical protein
VRARAAALSNAKVGVPRRGKRSHVRPRRQRGEPRHKRPLERDDVERPRRTAEMIRKLKSGEYRLYSRKKDPKTGRRRNLGTFGSRAAAEKHERAVQFFKRH